MPDKTHHALRDELPVIQPELSWTHYRLLLKVERPDIRKFYLDECIASNWSTRQLERQINSFYYERLLSSRNKNNVRSEIKKLEPGPLPIDIIKNPYVLEFLGMKVGKLTHQGIGQMDFYVWYFEKEIRQAEDNPTIGLILCAQKNEAMAKYTLLGNSRNVFASKYKLYLPTEKELAEEIIKERTAIETERKLQEKD
jgi:hypothetical protein